ncbi:unknown protein [Desulfotalea psychrophila LSv54]|uniref:Uncharacterized protein n=2 Tax=Desulfotalea psychrophila TaxID=84980 RepID=Q6AMR3_DESPS|nr:unknown protein [Desulfotalea psychrophila LSv54]
MKAAIRISEMNDKKISTCVRPGGTFIYGIHKPSYSVANRRIDSQKAFLGRSEEGGAVYNEINLPNGDVVAEDSDWVFEIANPLPFKGVTYINKRWADASAESPKRFHLPAAKAVSLHRTLTECGIEKTLIAALPAPLQLALATTSTDPRDLIELAHISCEMIFEGNTPIGLVYGEEAGGRIRAKIHNKLLLEAVANNIHLPAAYKIAMVIRPGAQGASPITGEWREGESHAYEYLRTNSYIPGGHYAANMAEDAIRYEMKDFSGADIRGLRRLYYQRSFIRLGSELDLSLTEGAALMTGEEIEALRLQILQNMDTPSTLKSKTSLWGWNFGFDYAPSAYRLHASHQQIHQQYAMIPRQVTAYTGFEQLAAEELESYACGDLIAPIIDAYHELYQRDYFSDYLQAIEENKRLDGRDDLETDLVIWSNEWAVLFVPKAQTSQWELQVMTRPDANARFVGNILEADEKTRDALDTGILTAQKALARLGAKMVTSIEYSKAIGQGRNQPIIYALLPRLPESPGAFSEAQMRFINGHYPEDFAAACRNALQGADL